MFYRKRGFTLLELMIVIIIVGILASLALPRFIEATRRAKEAEAKAILGAIRSAQLRYYLLFEEQYYVAANLDELDLDLTASRYYDYEAADAADGSGYLGLAVPARDGLGKLTQYEILEDGTIQE